MTLIDLFALSLAGRAETPGLEFQGRAFTFGQIDSRSDAVAAGLARRGLVAGDRLAVYLPNSVEMIDLLLACLKLGVIFVPINILYREREIAHILSDSEPRALVNWENLREWAGAAAASDAPRPPASLDGDSPAAVIYTSGTTGASKGAILTHNNFAANATNLVACWQITAADRFLLPLPLFHVHGLANGICCWLASGCRMRLLERFEHDRAASEFFDFRPTLFFGVPTIYVRLLELDPEIARSMRLFVSGSAPLSAQVLEEFRRRFGHVILERYGMTETLMNISNPYAGERRAGSVGLPLPGVSVRLLDPHGKPVAAGETGEVHLRGPNVFAGYWKRPEANRAAFRDGWFRTGDLATRSSDGYYTLQGRKSDLIISGGFNIYPREIEEFLLEQPEVAEAAVVGIPDRVKGEVPVACIVPRGGFDSSELERRCRAALASFKVPKRFAAVEALPRTALGKVQKHELLRHFDHG
ncbi:MAG: AMP-binding protein [Acidobacteria bacterium]|nr:AMP-binding protein [Acidobacteriota bacterium]